MRILLSNDDGINAPGLTALTTILKEFAELTVVAPEKECSAVSHALSIRQPIKIIKYSKTANVETYVVAGYPSDCVKLALLELLPQRPDICLSGINIGSNFGTDVIYSGTIAAATEAALLGIPAMALSADTHDRTANFEEMAAIFAAWLKKFELSKIKKGTLLNINFPLQLSSKKFKLTKLGNSCYIEKYKSLDKNTYVLDGVFTESNDDSATDYQAVKAGFISVTPLHFNQTDLEYPGVFGDLI